MVNCCNKNLHYIAFILIIIGGLNWLVLALFNWEIGGLFGGMDQSISKLIYILVGVAAIYELVTHGKYCSHCKKDELQKPAGM